MSLTFSAVLFDVDGTIVNSAPVSWEHSGAHCQTLDWRFQMISAFVPMLALPCGTRLATWVIRAAARGPGFALQGTLHGPLS